ncbi:MAG: bifunctional glutamate N-acetyltransferase/amino-acid acetyltransferase ArgJ [Oscillospiraceae bacterium]|nr:bifunctional glutamate N-acetyltransferase/amino-acid acetyltransferase ArgJ [Oscillospiraceae bacterium]
MDFQLTQGGVCAPKGFSAGGVHCGIRRNPSKLDLALIYSETPASAAGAFTQNLVKGAPVQVSKRHLADGVAQAIICNSGVANTCNSDGVEKAEAVCRLLSESSLGVKPENVVVASTGVIGPHLPLEPFQNGMEALVASLDSQSSDQAALGIMTTDMVPKQIAVRFEMGGKECVLGGIAKGSGMLHPNMATMLGFLTSDVAITSKMLQAALGDAVNETFNMISVDGDTSTNDMVVALANGMAGNPVIEEENEDYFLFRGILMYVCRQMARMIAKDGEGATKLLECEVSGARTREIARQVARAVVSSTLVKTAMYAEDANWGRILCAIGYCGAPVEIGQIDVELRSQVGQVKVCEKGSGIPFSEEDASMVLAQPEIQIRICIGPDAYSATAYGCDLTHEYIQITGTYRKK